MSRLRAALDRWIPRLFFDNGHRHLWWDETGTLPAMRRALDRSQP